MIGDLKSCNCWIQSTNNAGNFSTISLLLESITSYGIFKKEDGRPRWVNHEVKRSRPSWSAWWNPVSTKIIKISWVWWWVPVILAPWEAEAGESLELRRRRLQWVETVPLHFSLGDSETLSQKRKKKERKEEEKRKKITDLNVRVKNAEFLE